MSRGLGRVQRAIVEVFGKSYGGCQGASIVEDVARKLQIDCTPSLEASVRRALASLRARGIVTRGNHQGNYRYWWLERRGDPEYEEWLRESIGRAFAGGLDEDDVEKEEFGVDRRVLAKILGMLGSGHDGEALAAARKAEAERRKSGKTWAQLFGVKE